MIGRSSSAQFRPGEADFRELRKRRSDAFMRRNARAIQDLQAAGLAPAAGDIGITGATGGVGSLAVNMFAQLGYRVVAITGKKDQEGFLKSIGAQAILPRDEFLQDKLPEGRIILPIEGSSGVGGCGCDGDADGSHVHAAACV